MTHRIALSILVASAGLVALGLGGPTTSRSSSVAAAATPTPSGLQFDQIDKAIMGQEPPAPGTFQADYAAVMADVAKTTAAKPEKKRSGGLGGLLGGMMGNAGEDAMNQAMGAMRALTQGHLERFYYLKGWERVDDLTAQTATITKCDMHQTIYLNLAKKTYRIVDPTSATPEPERRSGATSRHEAGGSQGTQPAQPGTVIFDVSRSVKPLGSATIEGTSTNGYESTSTISASNAKGSCQNGKFGTRQVEYVSAMAEPRAVCPLSYRPPRVAMPEQMAAHGGCTPTFTTHVSGPTVPSDRFYLYRLISIGGGEAAGAGFAQLSERGNLKTLTGADLKLFDVPAEFTKET